MIEVKKGGQYRIVPEHKLSYWLSLGFEVVEQENVEKSEIDEKESLQAELDSLGICYDGRWGEEKLREVLEGAK